jgi:hypothetical protein
MAWTYNGTNQGHDYGDQTRHSNTNGATGNYPFSAAVMFRMNSTPSTTAGLLTKYGNLGNREFMLYQGSGGTNLNFNVEDLTANSSTAVTIGTVRYGIWMILVGCQDDSRLFGFLDGRPGANTSTGIKLLGNNPGRLMTGAAVNNDGLTTSYQFWAPATIAWGAIWTDQCLSPWEAQEISAGRLHPKDTRRNLAFFTEMKGPRDTGGLGFYQTDTGSPASISGTFTNTATNYVQGSPTVEGAPEVGRTPFSFINVDGLTGIKNPGQVPRVGVNFSVR